MSAFRFPGGHEPEAMTALELFALSVVAIIAGVYGIDKATWSFLSMLGVACLALTMMLIGIVLANGRGRK